MIDVSFLNELARFNLVINKRVTSHFIGPRKSIAAGRGLIFKDHRIYAPGDDFRNIDWKVYARTDDLYIKTFEEERNLVVHILMDFSGSMDFGKPVSKFDYGSMLGVGFAYLAMKDNEKFQFATFSEKLDIFQSRRGMSQLAAMVHHLNEIKAKGPSKLKESMDVYRKVIGSRSMVVLISDFLIPVDEIKESLYLLGKTHDVKIIQVLDPVEKDMRLEGDFELKDSESGFKLRTFVSQRLRLKYRSLLDDHSARIQELCNQLGMKFHLITTDTSIFDAFYKILNG